MPKKEKCGSENSSGRVSRRGPPALPEDAPGVLALDFRSGPEGGGGPVCGGRMEVFMEGVDPPRTVVIAGAGRVGASLHRILGIMGFRVAVLDPRPEFNNEERFPGAVHLVRPFEGGLAGAGITTADVVVILTPEHAFDKVVLREALASPAAYVGMIGSRKKVQTLFENLRREGATQEQLARVHAPVGLDIGAESPAEIALAIAAEIVACLRKGTLSAASGHGPPPKFRDG